MHRLTSKELTIQSKLLGWYKKNKRILPWRKLDKKKLPNSYYVLVSEFMLQQTTVNTVIPRFKDFIKMWPNLRKLSTINDRQILQFWSGLGYYATRINSQINSQDELISALHTGDTDVMSLNKEEELNDYTYRVAGCVGEFWTQMSLDHLFKIKEENEAEIFENGVRFGKALQMINILRDIPADLELGRCYIPRRSLDEHGMSPSDLLDSSKMESFRPLYNEYLDLTDQHLDSAVQYIEMLPHSQFRLRGSCMLPVIIGKKTVSLLRGRNVLDPEKKVKISRSEVKEVVKKVIMAVPFKGSSKRLLRE